ncbi:MAG: aspartate dehydrogenase [Candidatus Omnitrophota bacterium]
MKTSKLRVGIIGCGAIGSAIAKYCSKNLTRVITVSAIFDIDKERADVLKEALSGETAIEKSLDGLARSCDLIVEAASCEAARPALEAAARHSKDILVMSAGGLIGNEEFLESAGEDGRRVYVPSGAVAGLDGIKAARVGGIDEVVLTTKKPPEGLKGAPYIEENGIDLDAIKDDELIFEGSAKEAIKAFPKNVNVSATLSLAGIGAERTRVRIICSPGQSRNSHEIELKGKAGNFFVRTENVPSPDNPRTSYLAVLSAIAVLEGIASGVRVGT